jgi:predicted nucleic acid-binding protein
MHPQVLSKTPCITFVTVGELFKGAYKANWGQRRFERLEAWLHNVLVLPYDADVARTWGRLVAERERQGRPVSANDAWIAACCLSRGLPLMTLNRAHFEGIPGLNLLP